MNLCLCQFIYFLYLANKGHIAFGVHSWDLQVENVSNIALTYHVETLKQALPRQL